MFVYDPILDIFVFNEAPDSLPEIWHSVIPGQDVEFFKGFFDKVKSYDASPKSYAKPKVWIDDFPFLKQSYTQQQLDHYINKMLFTEAESYRRTNTLFGKVLKKEYEDDLVANVANADAEITNLAAQAAADPELVGSEEAQQAAAGIAE